MKGNVTERSETHVSKLYQENMFAYIQQAYINNIERTDWKDKKKCISHDDQNYHWNFREYFVNFYL